MKAIGSVFVVVLAMVGVSGSVPSVTQLDSVPEVLEAPSYVPAEERFIHIAGGFFSYFDQRPGTLADEAGQPAGSVSFELDKLCHESRFVYLPTGDITIRDKHGDARCFAMERLDYVQLPDSDLPAYRLAGEGATLVVTDSGREAPCLTGDLYVNVSGGYERYTVLIHGRSENDAERHLWQKIERATTTSPDEIAAMPTNGQTGGEAAAAL
jgi:hypothetical protein